MGQIIALCKKHKVVQLFVFGSILTDKFNKDSDVDFTVVFDRDALPLLVYGENYFDFKFALEDLLKRPVDLVEYNAIKNPYFKEELQDLGLVQTVEDVQQRIPGGTQRSRKTLNIGLQGHLLGNNHEEFLALLKGLVSYFLHGRKVTFDDGIHHLLESYQGIGPGLLVKRINAVMKIRLKLLLHLCFRDNVHGDGNVGGKKRLQGNGLSLQDSFILQVFAERHSFQRVRRLPAGHIHLGVVNLQHG